MTDSDLLQAHVANFNHGVQTGDFEPMLELFDEFAVMDFKDIPLGPFKGRAAIRTAYSMQPPDDTIRILDHRIEDDSLVATYAWSAKPDTSAGELIFQLRDGRITSFTVTFTTP